MLGTRWAAEQCARARFYMFVDDDYYVSTRNLLRFLRNPVGYPKYLGCFLSFILIELESRWTFVYFLYWSVNNKCDYPSNIF